MIHAPVAGEFNLSRPAAYHEAGHGVCALLKGARLDSVDLRIREPDGGAWSGGRCSYAWRGRSPAFSGRTLRAELVVAFAGGIAESRVNPEWREHAGFRSDVAEMAALLRDVGLDDHHALALVDEAMAATRRLVDAAWPAISRVAELLLERGTLGGREVARVVLSRR